MTSKTTRTLAGTVFIGAIAVSAAAFGAQTITNRAVGLPLQAALKAQKARDTKTCIAKAQEAGAVKGKTAYESMVINQLITACAIQGGNNRLALATLDKMIAAGQGNRTENLKQAMNISLRLKDNARAQRYLKELGGSAGDAALLLAQAEYQAGNYREAVRLARPLLRGGRPSKDLLELLTAAYYKLGDQGNRHAMLEQLTLYYPTKQYWHDLIQMTDNMKGLSDEERLQLLRLRLLVGDLTRGTDYSEMAQLAIIVGFPGEAKSVLMKAADAKMLASLGGRGQRLVNLTNQRVAADQKEGGMLMKKAAADPTGNADVQLGKWYLSYDKGADAEKAIRAGMKKGKLKDPAAAKIALGRALLAQNKGRDAVRMFNSVSGKSQEAPIARLWSIYAQHA